MYRGITDATDSPRMKPTKKRTKKGGWQKKLKKWWTKHRPHHIDIHIKLTITRVIVVFFLMVFVLPKSAFALAEPHYIEEVGFTPPKIEQIEPMAMLQELQTVAPVALLPMPPSVEGPANATNLYDWGNCTWYVASKRAIPNDWGNANTWLPRAQVAGYQTGLEPRVGAVAWFPPGGSLGHVAYVLAVNGDGTVLISEMNVQGLGVQSERIINAGQAEYIY